MTERQTEGASPVSFLVRMTDLPRAGRAVGIATTAEARRALADAHGLLSVESFSADLLLTPWKKDGFRLRGKVVADVVQQCVVTLEPLPAHVEAPVDILLVPESSRLAMPSARADELVLDVDSPDAPEVFSGNRFDVGALCEEFFVLALDPYPRGPDADAGDGAPPREPETPSASPFSRLGELRRKK